VPQLGGDVATLAIHRPEVAKQFRKSSKFFLN
jgi:hypothetical protein